MGKAACEQLERALCVALKLDAAGGAPEWVELVPAGSPVRGRDGRSWTNPDPEAIVAAFNASGVDLAVDMEHSQDHLATKGHEAPARGWIKELRHEGGGRITGRVEWTEKGRNAIESKEYRYLSPVLNYRTSDRAIVSIAGVALVNRPNLRTAALNRAGPDSDHPNDSLMNETELQALCAALGIAETSDATAITDAAEALKTAHAQALNAAQVPDLAKFVPRADYDALQSRVAQAENRIAQSEAAALEREITSEIDAAVKAGKITPATKDFYAAMCRQADGLARFRDFVKAAPRIIADGEAAPAGSPPPSDESALNRRDPVLAEAFGNSVDDLKKYG